MANDKTISATGAGELALKLAAKVSDQTMQDAEIILDAKEDDRRGPLVLAIDFKRDFSPAELASFPVVGSTEGNNPDVTKVPKEMANGGTREVNHYWYRHDFAPNTHLGITLAETIKDLSDKKKDTNNADPDDVALSLSRAQARLDAWGTRCERAFAYIQQCERWEAIADKVKYHLTMQRAVDFNGDLVTDDKGQPVMEVSKSPKPIKMWDATPNGKEIKFISLTSFLAFDVNEAAKNGGDWAALHATVGGDGETPKVKPITEVTLGRLADIYGRLNGFMDKPDQEKGIAREANKGDTGKHMAYEMMEHYLYLQNLSAVMMPLHDAWEQQVKDRTTEAAKRINNGGKTVTLRQAN